jgi:hypothetical protein
LFWRGRDDVWNDIRGGGEMKNIDQVKEKIIEVDAAYMNVYEAMNTQETIMGEPMTEGEAENFNIRMLVLSSQKDVLEWVIKD